MTPQESKYHVQAMNMVNSKERLLSMDANQYPHLEFKRQKEKHKSIYKAAFPGNFEKRVVTNDELRLV